MADIHQIISLGIGTPADIPHFVLFGLSPLQAIDPTADAIIRVRPDMGTIQIREDVATIRVRPDTGTVEI